MDAEAPWGYLGGIAEEQRATLARVNRRGLSDLRQYLAAGGAVAFLGAGASVPLYQTWVGTISELLDLVSEMLTKEAVSTCRALAVSQPDAVVEIIRRQLGPPDYRETLRKLFGARRDPATGKTWTPVHELVAQCNFAGIVTTNYDPGIANARMAVRPNAVATDFASWTDDDAMDRWRTRDVFIDAELPVLYAHGHHNEPDSIVLATTEYRRAYRGKLARVIGQMIDSGHLVWIGFSFADQRISAILREISEWSGTVADPGAAPRHVAVMPWNPDAVAGLDDPQVVNSLTQIQYGARPVLYPVFGNDHSALHLLLEELVDPQFSTAMASSFGQRSSARLPLDRDIPDPFDMSVRSARNEPPLDNGHIVDEERPFEGVVTIILSFGGSGLGSTAAAARLREIDRQSRSTAAALRNVQENYIGGAENLVRARHDSLQRSLEGLSEQTRKIAAKVGAQLQEIADSLWEGLRQAAVNSQEVDPWSFSGENTLLLTVPSDYRAVIEQSIQSLGSEAADQALDRSRNSSAFSEALIRDADVLLSAFKATLPHERYAPGLLAALDRRLETAQVSLAQGHSEAALALAQELYLALQELWIEVELQDMRWRAIQVAAACAVAALQYRIDVSARLDVTDEQGRPINGITLDVDFWSEGQLAALRAEVATLADVVASESSLMALEDLQAITERTAPELDERLTQVVGRAQALQLASQARVSLAEFVVTTLEEATAYVWEEGQAIYAQGDQRRAFYSKLRSPDESEIVIEVAPGDSDGECVLRIIPFDVGVPDRAESARWINVIVDSLRQHGHDVVRPGVAPEPADPSLTDFEQLRRPAPLTHQLGDPRRKVVRREQN